MHYRSVSPVELPSEVHSEAGSPRPLSTCQEATPASEVAVRSEADLLHQVALFLDNHQIDQALQNLKGARPVTSRIQNAIAVCWLRLSRPKQALPVLRSLALANGIIVRQDVPSAYVINLATALLLEKNLQGCESMLAELNPDIPAVKQLREAIRSWKQGLSFWEKVRFHFSGEMSKPLTLEFAPGVLQAETDLLDRTLDDFDLLRPAWSGAKANG